MSKTAYRNFLTSLKNKQTYCTNHSIHDVKSRSIVWVFFRAALRFFFKSGLSLYERLESEIKQLKTRE